MPIPSFDNLDIYFNDWDTVLIGPAESEVSIKAIFDNADGQIFEDRGAPVIVKQPMITAKSSDVEGLAKGHRVSVSGTEYKIKFIEDSGTGISSVFLTKA